MLGGDAHAFDRAAHRAQSRERCQERDLARRGHFPREVDDELPREWIRVHALEGGEVARIEREPRLFALPAEFIVSEEADDRGQIIRPCIADHGCLGLLDEVTGPCLVNQRGERWTILCRGSEPAIKRASHRGPVAVEQTVHHRVAVASLRKRMLTQHTFLGEAHPDRSAARALVP